MQEKQRLFFISLMFLLSISVLGMGVQASGDEIRVIELKGNEITPDAVIFRVIESRVGDLVSGEMVRKDMMNIFELGYFFDVKASYEAHSRGVKLLFEVVENPPLDAIIINGNMVISTERLKNLLGVKEQEMINLNHLNDGLETLMDQYHQEGFILADLKDVDLSPEGVLTIDIDEGYLEAIDLFGNEKTQDEVILREMRSQEGDIFNLHQVEMDLRRIYNLGFFSDVRPHLERIDPKVNAVKLVIEVDETKTGNADVGAGYSSRDGWLGYLEIRESNLLGRGQKLGFRLELGKDIATYEISFHEPYIFGTKNSFGISLYDRTFKRERYDEQRTGGSITLGRPLFEEVRGSIRYKHEDTQVVYVGEDPDRSTLKSLTLTLNRDTTFDPFRPRDGSRDTFSVESAGYFLGGHHDFTRYNLTLRRYFPAFMEEDAWAFRFMGGMITGDVPVHERFRVGGVDSIRGYRDNIFDGEQMVVINSEYRFPIIDMLEGVAFVDVGHTWVEGESPDISQFKSSTGVGVRIHTPIGQLRLDLGLQKDGSRIHFSIGPTF